MEELHELPEWLYKVYGALLKEISVDPDLTLLFTAGLLLASDSRPLKGIGIGMVGWFAARKADTYVLAITAHLAGNNQGGQ